MEKSFNSQLLINIQAGAPIVQIISHDTLRVHAETHLCANHTGRNLYIWNRVEGLKQLTDGHDEVINHDLKTLSGILDWFLKEDTDSEEAESEQDEFDQFDQEGAPSPQNSILLIEDPHYELEGVNPELFSKLKLFGQRKSQGDFRDQTLLFTQPTAQLPVELEKMVHVLHMPLPNRGTLKLVLNETISRYDIDEGNCSNSSRLLDAALGLSISEAQLAFSKVAVSSKRFTDSEVDLIVAEKEQVIKKSGLLEYFHPQIGLDEVGGLANLKAWLERRKHAYTEDAQNFGLDYPKGILMLGLPGTGKSLAAKAVSSNWQLPLLRLDMGKVFGGIVGQSEENIRKTLQMAETISPCILWIDEIEKGLSGLQGSGGSDGGTTARVLGTFLTWMQEKTSPVFVLATANHIELLPPELLRKGRVDEIFFVDLPTFSERIEIIKIHLKKRDDRDELFQDEDFNKLADISTGFTGAELEEAIKEALFMAFSEDKQIEREHIERAIQSTSPLSVTMHETIKKTREWIDGRAVLASSNKPEALKTPTGKKPTLKQERKNIFITE